jgi:hypothetical protein
MRSPPFKRVFVSSVFVMALGCRRMVATAMAEDPLLVVGTFFKTDPPTLGAERGGQVAGVDRQHSGPAWILHAPEDFICKTLEGKAIVNYALPLITQQMKACGVPEG